MRTKTLVKIQFVLCAIALALQFGVPVTQAAQKKEDPNAAPIVVSVDAQKKEAPTPGPGVTAVVREWLGRIGILPSAQKKE